MPEDKRKRERYLTGPQFAARFDVEKTRQQKRYCDVFALWRDCKQRRCRRDAACTGDANACLKRALATVLHHDQWQARQDILETTPANIGAPELMARQCMPRDFYAETTADSVAQYLKRHRSAPRSR